MGAVRYRLLVAVAGIHVPKALQESAGTGP
jgi:hypothetical protein